MTTQFFVGLDWAVHSHAVCIIDAAGAVRDRFEIAHDRDGLADLMRRLARFGASVRIAIERPSGLIVDALVEAGHQLFPIHPNAVKASRPRYRSHGGKCDASDAYLLADLLRTDGHRWAALAVRQDAQRGLSLGLQSAAAPSHQLPGRQLASCQRLGSWHLCRRAGPWLQSSPCHPHPRSRLAGRDLARLDRPQTL